MNSLFGTLLGRRLVIGLYAIALDANYLTVSGPDDRICRDAEERLLTLLNDELGCKLLGRALRTSNPSAQLLAATELAERIGLPLPEKDHVLAEGPLPQGADGRILDYDDDHTAIRAFNLPSMYDRTIAELSGICAAIVADKVLSDAEISMLNEWLKAKRDFADAWPISEISELIQRILSDGIVTAAERLQLSTFVDSIAASANKSGQASDTIFSENPIVAVSGKSFLFTGKLLLCKRAAAQQAVIERGGELAGSPNAQLDYLVVGDLGTEAWKFSRFGRKIEAVMENVRCGSRTQIIRESDFIKALKLP